MHRAKCVATVSGKEDVARPVALRSLPLQVEHRPLHFERRIFFDDANAELGEAPLRIFFCAVDGNVGHTQFFACLEAAFSRLFPATFCQPRQVFFGQQFFLSHPEFLCVLAQFGYTFFLKFTPVF
jgi:hypothetical protein